MLCQRSSEEFYASAVDLANYSIALDEGRILKPEMLEQMWTPALEPDGQPAAYAYGWYVQNWRGRRLVWHSGWWPDAYAGLLLKTPDDDWALVALGNTDALNWPNPLYAARVHESPIAKLFLETFVAAP
ncbi:MAG: serine hydrolase [Gammaproteobacteria bacterium]